jgi:hypothetical protein
MRFERTPLGTNWIFQFPDMVSKVKYIGLNNLTDARAIAKMMMEAK